ncbi:glutathione S-transferase N-terminal domain-containing protein, partial [Acinetobacter baumannii]
GKGRWSDVGPPVLRDRVFKGRQDTTRNRHWLAEHTGKVQVPYLIDPNTDTSLYESADIVRYLQSTYGR